MFLKAVSLLLALILSSVDAAYPINYTPPYSFSPGTVIQSGEVNADFSAISTVVNGQLDYQNLTSSAGILGAQTNFSAGLDLGGGNLTSVGTINGIAVGTGLPYGAIIPWWATDSTIPTGFALCNGQTTTWQTGPHAGSSVTLPNLIGMYIQGADITGGSSPANASGFGSQTNQSVVGAATHTHTYSGSGTTGGSSHNVLTSTTAVQNVATNDHTHSIAWGGTTSATNTQPPSYAMVFLMKLFVFWGW